MIKAARRALTLFTETTALSIKVTGDTNMAQHFLLSPAAKTLTLAQVFQMTELEAEAAFAKVRWPDTNGEPVCPGCGGLNASDCGRPSGAPRFRCRAYKGDFSIVSRTLFASHKMPLKGYLAAIAIFCNEVKGKAALALSRDLGTFYKTSFVLAHKLREAMAEELKGRVIGGEGKVAEVDGGYFGGYRKPVVLKWPRWESTSGAKAGAIVHARDRTRQNNLYALALFFVK